MSTFFYDAIGNISSIRTQMNDNMFKTKYPGQPGRGGTTHVGKHMTTRYDKNGRFMGMSIRGNRGTTYFDSNHRVTDRIAQF
jgi:hypothetical protein